MQVYHLTIQENGHSRRFVYEDRDEALTRFADAIAAGLDAKLDEVVRPPALPKPTQRLPDEIVPVRHQGELLGAWRQLTNCVDTEAAAVQLGGNALLLMPFGFVAPIRWPALANLWRILLATLAFGVLIEGLQFAAGFGRVASATDVLLYTIGGLLGYSLFRASRAFAGARFDGRRVTTTIELTRRVAQDRLSSDHLQGELASASRHYSLSWHPFRPGLTCNVKKEEARSG